MKSGVERFFDFARARHQIYLDRLDGKSPPWTKDPILARYRFTNVFRELDRVTIWLRQNVREQYATQPGRLLLGTVVFRLFNRITTGEAIFLQKDLQGHTAFEHYINSGDTSDLKRAILAYCGKNGPFITGSYIIKTPEGMSKLDGVLWIIDQFCNGCTKDGDNDTEWMRYALQLRKHNDRGAVRLEDVFNWMRRHPFIGDFTAYEIVTDLRHTPLLCNASDTMTWANPGPGCQRGIRAVFAGTRHTQEEFRRRGVGAQEFFQHSMRHLLDLSRNTSLWPRKSARWPRWEMREVEHTLCEFYKYEKARTGQGRPRGTYP